MLPLHPAPICEIKLPKEEVDQILDALDRGESDVFASKRRSARYKIRGRVLALAVFGAGSPSILLNGRLRNASRHGIAFIIGMMVPPGTRLKVVLPARNDKGRIEKEAIVRRCRHISSRIHELGAEFVSWSAAPISKTPHQDKPSA